MEKVSKLKISEMMVEIIKHCGIPKKYLPIKSFDSLIDHIYIENNKNK